MSATEGVHDAGVRDAGVRDAGWPATDRRAPVLVLGVGNELFTDEGLGVEAARRIAELGLPGVEVLDGGTLGVALLPEIADRQALLVLDAMVSASAQPGDVLVLRGTQVTRTHMGLMSAHQLGVGEAIATAEFAGRCPDKLAAVGMVPASLETGYGLSPHIAGALGGLIDQALGVLAEWGVKVADHA